MKLNVKNSEKLRWLFRYFFPATTNYCDMRKNPLCWESGHAASNVVKLCFVGDFGSINNLIMPEISSKLPSILRQTDYVVGNCEGVITNNKIKNTRSSLHLSIYDQYFEQLLHKLGLEANKLSLSLANNHSLDYGEAGLAETINYFQSKDIITFGHYDNYDQHKWLKLRKNNICINLQGWTHYINRLHHTQQKHLYTETDIELLCNGIEKQQGDFYIAFPHWGVEFEHFPRRKQIYLGHKIIDSGVDCIIGHHPHVLQPLEFYNNGACIYSLGNFIFDTYSWPSKIMPVFEIDLAAAKDGVFISAYNMHIFFRNHQKDKVVIQHLSELSKYWQKKVMARVNKLYE